MPRIVRPLADRSEIVERLGPQKVGVGGSDPPLGEHQCFVQFGVTTAGREADMLRAALGIEPVGDREPLEQGRLAGPVLPDEEGDRSGEWQGSELPHCRQRVGITNPIRA